MKAADVGLNRPAITICVILATLMQALDTTIANVALPYMQGSVSATQDQIGWVLTSYIVAAAIMTPPTGYLSRRFGLKQVFLVSVAGFTVASMLCGMAQSLVQIVLFRVMQGLFGAALVPLSQTVLLNINPREKQGSAMALWGVAVMAGPVAGPVLGGWLTDAASWRFVFYINMPVGILAFLGMMAFLPDSGKAASAKFDAFGFATLSIAIGAFQIMLDRGQEQDWFSSSEIITEALVAGISLYLFLIHTFTSRNPFIRLSIFKDANFAAGTLFVTIIGLTYYASLALQPPYLQNLMGYPIVAAGLVMGPRGLGTMAAMMIVGRLIGKISTSTLLGFGLTLTAWSFWVMTGWTPDVSKTTIVVVGIVQGLGLGFIFVPLSTVTLGTLAPADRPEGAGLYSLARNIGSSVGISVVNALLTRNTQINHASIAERVTETAPGMSAPGVSQFWNLGSSSGLAALNAEITRQASIIAYIDDYKLLMIAIIVVMPLLIVFKKPQVTIEDEAAGVIDH
jgi:DHA2 family multidrug resistance protein